MKKLFLTLGTVAMAFGAHGALYTTNWTTGWDNGTVVPDNNYSGWTDTRTIDTAPAGTLQGVAVDLQLSSAWVGDLYVYLVNDSGFAVLLDNVGQGTGLEPTTSYGYGAATWNITLANDGFNSGSYADIQSYGGGNLSGSTWNPASAGLTSFQGSSPNVTWTLFVADQSGGDLTTVTGWGLQMDIAAVPEPATLAGMIFGAGLGVLWLARSTSARHRLNQWKAAVNQWLDAA